MGNVVQGLIICPAVRLIKRDICDGMRPGVRQIHKGAMPHSSFEQSLKSVVVGITRVPPPGQEAVVGEWTQGIAAAQERACCPAALRNLVNVSGCELVKRPVSHIG